jgi:hypothetical protein
MELTNSIPQIFSQAKCNTVVKIKASKEDLIKSLNDKLSWMSVSYNKSSIMKRAYWLLKNEYSITNFSDALKASWAESRKVVEANRKEVNELVSIIENY